MEMGMRMISNRAGMRWLASSYTVAVIALTADATAAQTTRAMARAKSDTVVKADSMRIVMTRPPLMVTLRKIDSLVQLQEEMTIGSPEYVRVDDELRAAIRASMPSRVTFIKSDTAFSIMLAPGAASEPSRTPFAVARMEVDVDPRGWLGIQADGVHTDWRASDGHYYQYFVYPIVVAVDPNSPAAKVGVQFGDSLVAYNGMDLRHNIINLTRLIEPGRPLKVILRRDGQTKDVTIIPEKIPPSIERERRETAVAEMLVPSRAPMPAMAADSMDRRIVEKRAQVASAGGRGFGTVTATRAPVAMMVINGILGARMTDLDSSGVVSLTHEKASHGVLVTEVPAGSLAARMGLRSLDMIITVGDVDVVSLSQLRREMLTRGPNRATQFVVVRQGKTEKLIYDPK